MSGFFLWLTTMFSNSRACWLGIRFHLNSRPFQNRMRGFSTSGASSR